MLIKRVNIIGAGNVAHYLCERLNGKITISSIYSQNLENATILCQKVNSIAVNNLNNLSSDVDLNIVCVKDDALSEVLKKINKNVPIVHTSGSRGIELMKDFETSGIIYPLQTLSKNSVKEKISVPFLIEANTTIFGDTLMQFCRAYFSFDAIFANSNARATIHLAAVFANNFTNYLLSVSKDILDKEKIDFKILKPLMQETIRKAFETDPIQAQTGPAKRNDVELMNEQISKLESKELQQIYRLISDLISKQTIA